jgi:hypothetical protein
MEFPSPPRTGDSYSKYDIFELLVDKRFNPPLAGDVQLSFVLERINHLLWFKGSEQTVNANMLSEHNGSGTKAEIKIFES